VYAHEFLWEMKYFRFIMVSDRLGSLKQVRISRKLVRFALSIFGLFVLLNLLIAGWNIWNLGNSALAARFEKERDELEEQVAALRQNMDSLSAALTQVSDNSRALYLYAGIPLPEKGYAAGGPQLAEFSESAYMRRTAFSLDSLLFVAQQEAKALERTKQELAKRENMLRHTPSIIPMKGFISSGFGKRLDPLTGTWKMHEGVDICAPKGTLVHASADGSVKFAGWDHGFGKVVVIDHIWFETRYAHLDEILVKPGQSVLRGENVGICGRTGRTTGVHLHYEVRVAKTPIDPMDYILPQTVCID